MTAAPALCCLLVLLPGASPSAPSDAGTIPAPHPSGDVLLPPGAPSGLHSWLRTVRALEAEARWNARQHQQRTAVEPGDLGDLDLRTVDASIQVSPELPGLVWVDASVELLVLQDGVEEVGLGLEEMDLFRCAEPGGQPLVCEWSSTPFGTVLSVQPPHPLAAGESFRVDLGYWGTLDCDVDFLLPPCSFGTDRLFITHSDWYPTRPDAWDPFSGVLRVSIREGFSVGATGVFTDREPWEDGDGWTWVFEHPHPGFFLSFSAADFTRVQSHVAGLDIPLSVYVTGDRVDNAGAILAVMADVLTFYSDAFSLYPWGKLDAVELPDSFGGGYGPLSTIMVALSLFGVRPDEGGFYGVVDLFSHEIAHQWWGNLVAPGASDSVWLSEGFAEFSSKLHSEQRTGSRWGFMANGMSYVYGVPAADDSAIADTLTLINPHYVTIEYSKGSCVLDMLRHELGEGIFFELLQAYAERFGEGLATVADFEALAAEVSGQDLAWFFEQWLHRTGYPRATLGVERGSQATEGGLLLHVDQDPASFFRFTLPLRARCADGETEWVQAPVDAASVSVTLTACGGAVRGLDPDPERRLLRRFSTGMSPDINLDGSSDAADLLDMAWYYGRDIVFDGRDGGSWFWPNGSYRDLADLTGPTPEKPDGRVDMTDVELLVALLEAVSWTDPRSR